MRKLSLQSLFSLMLFSLSINSFAVDNVAPVTNVNQQTGIIDLGLKGKQLGQTQTTYRIPLHLDNAPIQADITLSFVVISTGTCPASYFPTEIFLNNESIAEIDFRELDEGSKKNLSVNLPMQYQQQGKNEIKIITGDCNEGLDSLRFNNVALRIEKSS